MEKREENWNGKERLGQQKRIRFSPFPCFSVEILARKLKSSLFSFTPMIFCMVCSLNKLFLPLLFLFTVNVSKSIRNEIGKDNFLDGGGEIYKYTVEISEAKKSGVDFVLKGDLLFSSVPFLQALPKHIPLFRLASDPCTSACSQSQLWFQLTFLIREILHNASLAHVSSKPNLLQISETLGDLVSSSANGTFLPSIPCVTIYNPCKVNNSGHLDFMPYYIYKDLIPKDAETIYIMVSLKSNGICTNYYKELYSYLSIEYPCKMIVLLHENDPYLVISRIVLSKTSVCINEDCNLFAVGNQNTVYIARKNKRNDFLPNLPSQNLILINDSLISTKESSLSLEEIIYEAKNERGVKLGKTIDRPLGNDRTTVVSSYYMIPSKYKHAITYNLWIDNYMKMNFKAIIYGDKAGLLFLKSKWPESERRKYIEKPFEAFKTSAWNWTTDFLMDPEKRVGHNELLYKVWNEKIFLVAEVVSKNPFNTDFFAWVDIGAFRRADVLPKFRGFPDPQKFNRDKVTFLQINPFTSEEKKNTFTLDSRFLKVDRIGGGHFAGNAKAILKFRDIFQEILIEAKNKGVFAGKDQTLFAFSILRHPEFLTTVSPARKANKYSPWFMLHHMWSSSATSVKTSCTKSNEVKFDIHHQSAPAKDGKQCDAFLMLLSTAQSQASRDAIRSSWLANFAHINHLHHNFTYKYKFVVGRDRSLGSSIQETRFHLRDEMDNHNDILILPFDDSYLNLTVKVGLMFKLVGTQCKYIFKIDEDVYIRSLKFLDLINSIPDGDVYGGYIYDQVIQKSEVSRDPNNRNSLTVKEFPARLFEPYAGGPVYFLSSSLAQKLPYSVVEVKGDWVPSNFLESPLPALYKLEDAYMGHMVGQTTKKSSNKIVWHNVETLFSIDPSKRENKLFTIIHGIKKLEQMKDGIRVFGV